MGDDETVRDALNAPHLDALVDSCIDVVEAIRAKSMPERGRKVLLDALGHGDCVGKDRLDRALDAAETYLNRAERAERERDALRDLVRAAGALISESHITCPEHLWEEYVNACADAGLDIEGEDLSADADAEPEPRDAELRDRAEQVAAGGADFCTAWNDEFGLCDRPPDHPGATVTWRDTEPSRADADAIPMGMRSAVGGTSRGHGGTTTGSDAGGRPREADPQGPSNGSGGASVDGGGDDGRSRAIDYYEGVRQGLSFARDVVVGVMRMYPEDVFTEDGTTPDAIAARMARHVCQVILDGLVFDEGCESQGCVLTYKHEGGCEY